MERLSNIETRTYKYKGGFLVETQAIKEKNKMYIDVYFYHHDCDFKAKMFTLVKEDLEHFGICGKDGEKSLCEFIKKNLESWDYIKLYKDEFMND